MRCNVHYLPFEGEAADAEDAWGIRDDLDA
jgi:hypothetical protein